MLQPGLHPEEVAHVAQLSGYYTTGNVGILAGRVYIIVYLARAGNAGILAGRVYIIVYLARASRQGWQRSQYC